MRPPPSTVSTLPMHRQHPLIMPPSESAQRMPKAVGSSTEADSTPRGLCLRRRTAWLQWPPTGVMGERPLCTWGKGKPKTHPHTGDLASHAAVQIVGEACLRSPS
eukprot:scaffold427_cov108-Isochrysis_galbana.AAC.2